MSPPVLKVCSPVQIGVMFCASAGEASERIKVRAVPLFAVRPIETVGFAPTGEAVRQVVPSMEKQVERTPPAKVEVPPETVMFPPMFMYVVVAFVPIPLVKLRVGKFARREYRSVELAFVMMLFVPPKYVLKRLVLVAFVISTVPSVDDAEFRFCNVDEAREMRPPVYVWRLFHVFVVVVAGKRPATARRASGLEKYRLVLPCVRSSVVAPPTTCPAAAFNTPVSPETVRLFVYRLVEEALVMRTVPSVVDAEERFCIVDEAREMSPFV